MPVEPSPHLSAPASGPDTRTGAFVSFEGGEGAGKSTVLGLVADALRAAGTDPVVTREPGGTDLGRRVRAILLDVDTETGPRAELLLYLADRAHHVATVVRPALAAGRTVLTDRYVDSTFAYQGAGRALDPGDVEALTGWATGGLVPDLVVLLDVDPRDGLARAGWRGTLDRLETEGTDFHDRVRRGFLERAGTDPGRYLVLDGLRPAEETVRAVLARLAAPDHA